MAGTLVIMCGIPGSGKSTYAKNFLTARSDIKYISRDEIRFSYLKDNDSYFKYEKIVYEDFCSLTKKYLEENYTVIADATFLNKKSRKMFLDKINIKPYKLIAKVINTPFETCVKRNAKREGRLRVPYEVMVNMHESFEYPTVEEGFDKVEVI